jgi:hypothetical protein
MLKWKDIKRGGKNVDTNEYNIVCEKRSLKTKSVLLLDDATRILRNMLSVQIIQTSPK